ncbi:MAG: D-aminoacyl-tRNA deacylase [Candidatus Dormibacteraceae bacterium]
MRLVIQRVSQAAVSWDGGHSEIGRGLAILVGVGPTDDEAVAAGLAEKVAQLRIFDDPTGRTNLSLEDIGGEALVVSQFTLYADLSRGRRPGFTGAAAPARAEVLYTSFAAALAGRGIRVRTGSFGAEMELALVNHGPFTLNIDTDNLSR